ncbi:MAG: B12-binding domain-containing radical SAM protein [Ruminococcaceae bacterium]|nr:B12-binding domain-containing radical SAM protein [Oscillospiraceae bacterium]
MYIKLIQPKMEKRPMDTDIKIHMAPPLGLLTIVNLLRNDHRVVLENENVEDIQYDAPDIVGISITVDVLPRAIKIAKKFREQGCIVVAGGIHITTATDTIPPDCFDVLCVGAAEGTWPDIIRDHKNGTLKYIYRCKKNLKGRDLVPPAYDFIEKGKYLYCNVIHTSRGCPFRCDFCYNSGAEQLFLNREIDDVIREIKEINTKHIMFIDDNFIGNKAWTYEFLEAIKPLKIKWNAAASINAALDEQLLDLMKESGCQGLFIGFESISQDSIKDVHKVQNHIETYEKAVYEIHRRGIMINASFVFGLDGDTKETFRTTLDWIVKNKIETVTSHILTPYPGTALYRRMKEENRITSEDLSLYNTANVVFQPKNMTSQELMDGYLWIYRNVYSFKNIIKRMPEAKSQRAAYLMFNLFYRKWGKITDFLCKCISYKRIGIWAEKISHYL